MPMSIQASSASYAAGADLSALSVLDTIVGSHGNTNGMGLLLTQCTLGAFGSQSPDVRWVTQGNAFGILHLRNLVTSSQIPVGANVTLAGYIVAGLTGNSLATGDNFLPDEVVDLLQSLQTNPAPVVAPKEALNSGTLANTMTAASAAAVQGVQWFQDNAVALTTVAGNGGFDYHVQTGAVLMVDDEDSNYGEAYKLAGLCLRFLRTGDLALVPMIEAQAAYHVQIEQDAVAQYGSFWSGSVPYFYWPSPISSGSTYTVEGGVTGTTGTDVDPAFGVAKGPITYTQGQVRRATSIDQMHMMGLGLYHYLYLLRNETAITANTTLRASVLSYLSRVVTFEAAHWTSATSRFIANLYAVCTGVHPTNNVGMTSSNVTNPYNGQQFGGWQVSDTDLYDTLHGVNPSSNVTLDNFFNSTVAPNSTVPDVKRYMQGMTKDMLASDFGRHDVTDTTASWNLTYTTFPYPAGWLPRAAGGTQYRFNAARAGDDHYLEVQSGYRDSLNGRAAQRMIVVALTAMMDPTYRVPIEMTGGTTVVRDVLITDAVDALARTIAVYGPEPMTKAQRYAVAGWMGEGSSFDPQRADSAMTGYWLMASELWHLVRGGVSYSTLYPIGTF
jgi:hypothetical protein